MRKYTLFTFVTGDFKAVEDYLNRQADKGWELERAGAILARWKRTERHDLRWCVDLANPREKNDREARKDYVDFCAEGGWELLTLRNNMYIFRSMPGMTPPPVQTDPELERKNYNKYYVRSTILGAIYVIAMIVFYAFLILSTQLDLDYTIQSTRLEWHRHWLAVGTLGALPLWGIWAVWRFVDFIRAMVSNRGGVIGVSPRWIMWANSLVSAVAALGTTLFALGYLLEGALGTELPIQAGVMLVMISGAALFHGFTREFELYQGENRFVRRLGFTLAAVFAAMIAVRVAAPYGEWSTNTFDYDRDYDGAMAQYELLEGVPVVRGEDLGVPLDGGKNDYMDLTWEYTPVGERWEVEYTRWDTELSRIGCETFVCPTLWQAELTESQMLAEIRWWSDHLNREGMASYIILTAPPQVEMEPVTLDWADEAWYGANETASVLVVRIGTQVTRLSAPQVLMTEELLSVIQAWLCG